jgi:DNA-binding NarL/FixJ family response regulator
VSAGGAVFGAGVATQILTLNQSRPQQQLLPRDELTEREREVLALVAQGSSNAQIARALGLSLKTVQNYVSRILDKLQVADRTQAALRARDVIS